MARLRAGRAAARRSGRVNALKWDSVLAWRLERQHLATRAPRDGALGVVSDIAGLHAQVASCAELTLWARVEGLERGALSRLRWDERALVKTWAMRGTLQLAAIADALEGAELTREELAAAVAERAGVPD